MDMFLACTSMPPTPDLSAALAAEHAAFEVLLETQAASPDYPAAFLRWEQSIRATDTVRAQVRRGLAEAQQREPG